MPAERAGHAADLQAFTAGLALRARRRLTELSQVPADPAFELQEEAGWASLPVAGKEAGKAVASEPEQVRGEESEGG